MTHPYYRRTSKTQRILRSVRDNLAFYCLVLLMIAAAVVLIMDLKPTPTVVPQNDQKEHTEQAESAQAESVERFTEERIASFV